MSAIEGRSWVVGDDVDTDAITPSKYLVSQDPGFWASHVLENLRPEFASGVRPGDILVAGHSFGSGSSREHAPIAVRTAGISAVIAGSFARNFYRSAFNNGLIVLEVPGVLEHVTEGDRLRVDLASGEVSNLTRGTRIQAKPVPRFLIEICEAGGLIPWLSAHGGWDVATA